MNVFLDQNIQHFIRTCMSPFRAKDFSLWLSRIGLKASVSECTEFLDEDENIFYLDDELYATRACIFTNQYFSFKPTRREIDRGVFIAGDRCIPFVDSEILSCDLIFTYNGKPLPKKVVDYKSDDAIDLFLLYGEEFAPHYIAADPANEDIDLLETDFLLPSDIKMSSFSLEPILKKEGFSAGDRMLCRVTDWNKGIVEICKVLKRGNPFQEDKNTLSREKWYDNLEHFLEESFRTVGPCSMIEEQLALVFAAHRDELCTEDCGGIEEFFRRSKKIGLELFGVETRIWHKNEDVPAIGKWNNTEISNAAKELKKNNPVLEVAPQFIEDAYLRDSLYSKKDNLQEIVDALYPHLYRFDSTIKSALLLHLKNRHAILAQTYNRFADYEISEVRKKALELFANVNEMVCAIDMDGFNLADYPQQPLVILSQIYGHIIHIIEGMESHPSEVAHEIDEVSLSLDGMEFNFNEIYAPLRQTLDRNTRNGFSVGKNS